MKGTDHSVVADSTALLAEHGADCAMYILDRTGRVVSGNPAAEALDGQSVAQIIGQHYSQFFTEVDRQLDLPEQSLLSASREGHFVAEGWRLRKGGSQFWANVAIDVMRGQDGTPSGFVVLTRDLTQRKGVEEDLRKSEERFRLLVEGITDYAIYMISSEGLVTSWNAGAQRFKGYTSDEIIGQHFSLFYTAEDCASGLPQRALKIALREGHFEAEGWRVRKDGEHFWASVVIDPIRDPQGKLLGFAKITRDLTERRETQLALDGAREAFIQSQKVEAIGRLTGGVAHDFNNLLAAIIGSLDLAEKRQNRGQEISQFIQNARSAAERGSMLTQRMLAFARKQELKLEAVDLTLVVRGMADLLARTIGPAFIVNTEFPLVLPKVRADAYQLELAILNLAVNARDSMPNGGRIVISARASMCDQSESASKGFISLAVSDEGEGMDEETLSRATDPFFTTKGVGKGTGLGLSMVRGMVEQCDGIFKLTSTPGKGTTAEMCLPIAGPMPELEATIPIEAIPVVQPVTILAVDDDPIILMNTAMILEGLGHTVYRAHSGAKALEMLAEVEIELLITDYAMPGMSGAELISAALSLKPQLSVLLASGYADLPSGAPADVARLAKPFNEPDLVRAIAAVLG